MKKTKQKQKQIRTQTKTIAQEDFQIFLGALYLAAFCTCFYVLSIV